MRNEIAKLVFRTKKSRAAWFYPDRPRSIDPLSFLGFSAQSEARVGLGSEPCKMIPVPGLWKTG
jgi:hypothetical protein